MRWIGFLIATVAFALVALCLFAFSTLGDCFNELCFSTMKNQLLVEGAVLSAGYTAFCTWRFWSAPSLALRVYIAALWIAVALLYWQMFFRFNL